MTGGQERSAVAARARSVIQAGELSQRQVAAQMGIDETKLSKSLSGLRRFSATELFDLATVTGATVTWLLGDRQNVSVTPPEAESTGPVPVTTEHARRQRTIVEAAWKLFADHGFESVRVADIAAQASVSTAGVHYHFPHKSDLFEAVLRYSVKLAYDRQVAWLTQVSDPRERLVRLLDLQSPLDGPARQEWSIWIQAWARCTLAAAPRDDAYVEMYRRWWQTVRAAVEDGQGQGLIRAGSADGLTDEITSVLDGLGIKVLTGVTEVSTMRRLLADYLDRAVLVGASAHDYADEFVRAHHSPSADEESS